MKKQTKPNAKGAKGREKDPQTTNEGSVREKQQPVPQPKDFEEIEY
ncbi:hypothetical protein [Halalkalibacter alkalisediminis]|uniref:Spore protein n=1 Tax=Halalkalibacter alkalisediminis TaxID=935616 RepID=A0ABV6NJT8_9BACI|nr:hypothetical protein [Halalkalibacter alkalisediminis]